MSIVVTRLFDSYDRAATAVSELEKNGIAHNDISLVANNVDGRHDMLATSSDLGSGAGTGATIGTVLGGGAGLVAGLGMLAIPGVGPVVAAGWLVTTALGAGVGAGAGGLLGSLVGAGVDETDAKIYSEGVRGGGTLVTVRGDESERAEIERVMARFGGVDAMTRGIDYRAGDRQRLDEATTSYTAGASASQGVAPTSVTAPGFAPELEPHQRSNLLL